MTYPILGVDEEQVWLEARGVEIVDLTRRKTPTWPLRLALQSGLAADPDPRRPNFYEADVDGFRYYFCVLSSGRVLLLARSRKRGY